MNKYTSRGFRNYSEQKDTYGVPFRLRESSAAGIRAVWLFVDDPKHMRTVVGGKVPPALHLSEANARRLIVALQKFLDGE